MKPESLIFDIDGTLWDSRALVAKGYNQYLCRIGHPELQVDAEFLKTVFGKTMQEIADIMLSSIPAPRRYEILDGCMECQQAVLESDPCQMEFPGVVETLEQLARQYRLFIVSNSQKGYPELLISKLKLEGLIEGHLCYGDTGAPKGETIKLLMQRHGIGSAVYIGDTQGDLDACRTAGIPFIFCTYGFGSAETCDARIDTFGQLPQVLDAL